MARLVGRDCLAQINDDRLGRALDRFYDFGCDRLFATLATEAALRCGISKKFRHLDSTSMNVHGDYESDDDNPLITFGYSKDHRSDLKQFMIYLMTSQDGDVPLLAQTVAGNSSDKQLFRDNLKALKSQIEKGAEGYFIADSALYTKGTLKDISPHIKWVTRVPENITEAKQLLESQIEMKELEPGYSGLEVVSNYGDTEQKWLLVDSKKARIRAEKTLKKRIAKEQEQKNKEIKKLFQQDFDCESDAKKALKRWSKSLKYHQVVEAKILSKNHKKGKGRPRLNEAVKVSYRITAQLKADQEKISKALIARGRFIIATNELDPKKLSGKEMLSNYKEQQGVERGFRFLKDSSFMTSSVFLKKQERIIALGMVMCLCLLVYMITQRHLRKRLKETNSTVPSQTGKPTKRPSLKWIFQVFEGVHLLLKKGKSKIEEKVLNLNQVKRHVLMILGPPFEKIYSSG